MLRFHKFSFGFAGIPEFGNPDKEIDFKNLLKYFLKMIRFLSSFSFHFEFSFFLNRFSPLHNVPTNASKYPAMMIGTGK